MKIQKIRDAAQDQQCTLEILGVCNGDTATTVLAHLPDESNGMGKKSDDISACFACSSCHDAIDSRDKMPESEKPYLEWYMRRAMVRTWRILINDGVIKI